MYDLGCPRDYTVDIHVITMVGIRLWLFGITSAMLGLRIVTSNIMKISVLLCIVIFVISLWILIELN